MNTRTLTLSFLWTRYRT